jgi:RHS repeat-associated protein
MSFGYDNAYNQTSRTDYNGNITSYTYDNLNRLTAIAYTGSSDYASYTYDDLSRPLSAENQNGTVEFTYNNRGWLASETDVFGHVLEYSYDPVGNRTSLDLDSATQTTYAYDNADRLTTLTDESSNDFNYSYDAADRLTSVAMPNGITSTYEYDGMSRLTRLKHENSSSTLYDDQFCYNSANLISQIAGLSATKNYTYDNINRLTGMTDGTNTESYSYDGVGNRTASHLSSSYTTGSFNRLTATDTASYSYNSNGSMTGKTVGTTSWTYGWDRENRMVSAGNGTNSVAYLYDALGRRVKRTQGSDVQKYTHDGADVVLDDINSTLTKYQNGPGIDNKLKAKTGSTSQYYLQDHLGSSVGLANASGSITDSSSYDSFGNPTNTSFPSRYRFTGREFDTTTGIQYSRARFYDPGIGRFTSEDPIGFRGGDVNLYGYVRNEPFRHKDPHGLDILVIENGPTGDNPFGHTALAISGRGLITYGNADPAVDGRNLIGGPVSDYLSREASRRNSKLYIIPTTPEQDDAAFRRAADIDYFRPPLNVTTIIGDNCSLRSNQILDAAGIPNNNWFFPDTYPGTAGSRAEDVGATPFLIPHGNPIIFLPYDPDLSVFEPIK